MGARFSVSMGKVSTGALTTGSAKSLILVNPVTNAIASIDLWLGCGANTPQTDIAVELYRTTTLGSPAGTTGTIVKDDPNSAAGDATALTALSAEPTAVEKLRECYFPVNQGLLVVQWPLGREEQVAAAGARMGLRVVNDEAGTMTAVNFRGTLAWEVSS